jgi:hypothetical protein
MPSDRGVDERQCPPVSADGELRCDPLDKLLAALGRLGCDPRRSGSGWLAKCPAHDDKKPSLSISAGADGRVLLHCFASCVVEAIVAALGLSMSDLFPESPQPKRERVVDRVYDYVDASGALVYQVVRMSPKKFFHRRPDGQGGWVWDLKGVERVPYRLPELLKGVAGGDWVFVVEGEKDVDCLVDKGSFPPATPISSRERARRFFPIMTNPANSTPSRWRPFSRDPPVRSALWSFRALPIRGMSATGSTRTERSMTSYVSLPRPGPGLPLARCLPPPLGKRISVADQRI